MSLKVATYNIHRCIGTDGREDVGRVAAVLQEIDAHVVGLQEAEARPSRTSRNQAQELARRLNLELIEGPLLIEGHGHYGNALLSRLPVRLLRRNRFGRIGLEARGFLHVEVADPDGPVWHVIATHLDLGPRARSAQLRVLARELALAPHPALIMGDLNEWRGWTRALATLRGAGRLLPARPSFPSRLPLLALDRIAVRGARVETGPIVHRTELSRRASDHLPVWAKLKLSSRLA
jgi:endonuclease/exonuclease/phosphatase family metal-dependent hydrolase